MLKKILIGVAVLLVGLCGVIAAQPSTYRVERSTSIAAPPSVAFAQINDFHKWTWSPWDKLDPNQKRTYEGAESGVGAKYHWAGNDDVGEGRMEITESRENERVAIRLEFIRPFPSTSSVDFTVSADGEGSKVVWGMDGTNDFMGKAFCLFVDMDKMLGADFEKGLAAMKTQSEDAAKALAEAEARKKEEEAKAAAAAAAAAPADGAAPADAQADAAAATP